MKARVLLSKDWGKKNILTASSGARSSHLSYRPFGIAEEKFPNYFILHGLNNVFN
jgi:hypothetical protein